MIKIDFGLIKPYLKEENFLGEGTYGNVYKGCFRSQDVAIKKINNSGEAVKRESDILMIIECDHIIQLIATVYENPPSKYVYLIMEYMNGGTLHKLIHDHTQTYNFVDVISWFLQAAKGLKYLHSRTPFIIHRDVKPENMLLDESRKTLKFCDLGKAREYQTKMTEKSGTGTYIAPEVLDSKLYDTKCDIYSLSISLAETLIRKDPYHKFQGTPLAIAQQIKKKVARPDISKTHVPCTDEVKELIKKGWQVRAADRPTAQQFVSRLSALMPKIVD